MKPIKDINQYYQEEEEDYKKIMTKAEK